MINFIWCLSLILYLLAFHSCCVFQGYPGPNLRCCELEICALLLTDWMGGRRSSPHPTSDWGSGVLLEFPDQCCSRGLGCSGRPLPFAGLRETRRLLMLSFGSNRAKAIFFLR